VQTNIVIFEVTNGMTAAEFVEAVKGHGVLVSAFYGPHRVRSVRHSRIMCNVSQCLRSLRMNNNAALGGGKMYLHLRSGAQNFLIA
jgi:hypothetical protein